MYYRVQNTKTSHFNTLKLCIGMCEREKNNIYEYDDKTSHCKEICTYILFVELDTIPDNNGRLILIVKHRCSTL